MCVSATGGGGVGGKAKHGVQEGEDVCPCPNLRWRLMGGGVMLRFLFSSSSFSAPPATGARLLWSGEALIGPTVPPTCRLRPPLPLLPSVPSAFDTLDVSRVKERLGGKRRGESRGEVRSSELEMCHLLGLGHTHTPDPRHPPPPPNWI